MIGHLKEDYCLSRNYYKGIIGDEINVMLVTAGFIFKLLDRGDHFCDEPDPAYERFSYALFCLVTIEADESEKYRK